MPNNNTKGTYFFDQNAINYQICVFLDFFNPSVTTSQPPTQPFLTKIGRNEQWIEIISPNPLLRPLAHHNPTSLQSFIVSLPPRLLYS